MANRPRRVKNPHRTSHSIAMLIIQVIGLNPNLGAASAFGSTCVCDVIVKRYQIRIGVTKRSKLLAVHPNTLIRYNC